jgi:hypothetical protein
MGGGGGTTVQYQAPPKDDTFERLLQYQQASQERAEARAAAERKAEADREAARKAAGQAGYGALKSGITSQLQQGLIGYEDASSRLRDYALKYDMTPPETDVSELGQLYQQEILPGRRQTAVGAAYEEILGRQATEEERSKALERFQQGYYSSNQELRDSLYKSEEYQDKYNQSYLDNYYDTKFGKQTVDEAGKKTGVRTFKFDSKYLPSYLGTDLSERAQVQTPDFGDQFEGSPAELEEQVQNMRDTRQYLYSAGLTNLQGEIDKETQKLKNEGLKEVTKIQQEGNLYSGLLQGFWN